MAAVVFVCLFVFYIMLADDDVSLTELSRSCTGEMPLYIRKLIQKVTYVYNAV